MNSDTLWFMKRLLITTVVAYGAVVLFIVLMVLTGRAACCS